MVIYTRTHVHYDTSLNYFYNENYFRQNLYRKSQHILRSIIFSPEKTCRLCDNVENYGKPRQATDNNMIRRMDFECWKIKATDIHSEYVILIVLARQQKLRECTSMLPYANIACVTLTCCCNYRSGLVQTCAESDRLL